MANDVTGPITATANGRVVHLLHQDPVTSEIYGAGGTPHVGLNSLVSADGVWAPKPKWRRALARVLAGASNATMLHIGDSTTAGAFASGSNWAACRAISMPTQLAGLMSATGIPVCAGSTHGAATNSGTSLATFASYDTRWTFGANWAAAAINTAGGGSINNQGAGNYTAANFTPSDQWDTVDIWYIKNAGYGSFTISANGGAAIGATVACAGTLSVQKATRTTTLGFNTLNITKIADGNIILLGVSTYNSQRKTVNIFNAGWGSSKSADWIASANVWDPLNMVDAYAPDLTVINLTINEWIAGTVPATYQSQMDTIINRCRLYGDVVLMTGAPSTVGTTAKATQDGIVQACRALGQKYACDVVDVSQLFGDWTTGSALGYYSPAGDAIHPGQSGYALMASELLRRIR